MHPVLTRILRPVVKALYRLILKAKRLIRRQRRRRTRQTAPRLREQAAAVRISPAVPAVSGASPAAAPGWSVRSLWLRVCAFFSEKGWWKRWPALAGMAILAAAVAVVLMLALPGAAASDAVPPGGAYAALVNALPEATPSASPEPSPSAIPTLPSDPVKTVTASSEPVPTPEPTPPPPQPGMHDERVIEIQSRLMELGYMDNDEPTDYYGSATKYALQLFQRKHKLSVDGLIGEQTWAALFSKEAQPYTVKLGDRGTDVKEIQQRLKELKYFSGSITGEFGEKTEAAVKAFQKRNGLTVDGNVGEHTRDALFSEDAKPAKSSSGSGSSSGGSNSGSSGGKSGGSSKKTGSPATKDPDAAKVDALIAFAQTLLGKEYTRGGKGPDAFDCSGFVYYCLNNSGAKSIKYMTSGAWAKSSYDRVDSISDLKPGDIICFKGHVAIYMGGGQMIHASSSADKVVIGSATGSWAKRNFICGRRVVY